MTVMDINEILKLLPHRYPFVFIDKVIAIEMGKSLTALKNVSINEQFFVGHFPGKPIMPGVLILEAMAQAGAILAYASSNQDGNSGVMFYFAGIDNARFRRIVEPGDQLRIEVDVMRAKRNIWKLEGHVYVGKQLACSAQFMSAREG